MLIVLMLCAMLTHTASFVHGPLNFSNTFLSNLTPINPHFKPCSAQCYSTLHHLYGPYFTITQLSQQSYSNKSTLQTPLCTMILHTPSFILFILHCNHTLLSVYKVYILYKSTLCTINFIYKVTVLLQTKFVHSRLMVHFGSLVWHSGAVHTKIDLSWIDLRSISVRFEKVFTLI